MKLNRSVRISRISNEKSKRKGKTMSKEKNVEPVAKPKRITLQYLIKYELPIWVINRGSKGESCQVVLQAGDRANWKGITIPPGSDPICLTDLVPTDSLKSCYDLSAAIEKGALELLDPEKAEEYYDEKDDRRQVVKDKLNKYMYRQQENVPEPKAVRFGDDDMGAGDRNQRRFRDDGMPEGVSQSRTKFVQSGPKAKVGDLCQKAQFDAVDERGMLESLLELGSSLTAVDLDYIEKNGKFDSVRRWAKDQLKSKE